MQELECWTVKHDMSKDRCDACLSHQRDIETTFIAKRKHEPHTGQVHKKRILFWECWMYENKKTRDAFPMQTTAQASLRFYTALSRSTASPHECSYKLQFRAVKRRHLAAWAAYLPELRPQESKSRLSTNTENVRQKMYNTVQLDHVIIENGFINL